MAHGCSPVSDFWGYSCPLRPEDVSELEYFQTRHIKAALGLPPQAHHSALLTALGVPHVQETLRGMALRGLANALRTEHRLSRVFTRGLALLATAPSQLDGSFLGLFIAYVIRA